jgi:hypothetical protein
MWEDVGSQGSADMHVTDVRRSAPCVVALVTLSWRDEGKLVSSGAP